MANKPFDTVVFNNLERPLSGDLNAAQSEIHRELREFSKAFFSTRASALPDSNYGVPTDGVVGNSLRVRANGGLSILIESGMGFRANNPTATNINGISGLNDLSDYAPMYLSANQAITIPAPPGAGLARIDRICVKADRYLTDTTSRDIFNPTTLTFTSTPVSKTLSTDLYNRVGFYPSGSSPTTGIAYITGNTFAYSTPNDFYSAAHSSAPSGYELLAYVNVRPSMATVADSDIVDTRQLLLPYGTGEFSVDALIGHDGSAAWRAPGYSAINLPPGAKIAVVKDALTTNTYDVYLFCGTASYLDAEAVAYPNQVRTSTSNITHDVRILSGISSGSVDATLQGDLANAVVSGAAFAIAIGQEYYTYRVKIFPPSVIGSTILESSWPGPSYPTSAQLGSTHLGFRVRRTS